MSLHFVLKCGVYLGGCVLVAVGAAAHSPTIDEAAHLPAGLSHWHFARFDLYRVNPPLVRMVAAVPLLAVDHNTNWQRYRDTPMTRAEFAVGRDFAAANGERSQFLFVLARWACLPFFVAGAWVCCRWATELFGGWAGLVALALWCFCPNLLGHGQLLTPDVPAAALGVAGLYIFCKWLRDPNWTLALASGFLLGLAQLAKTTNILLVVLYPALWLIARRRGASVRQGAWQLLAMMFSSLLTLNAGYGFEGSFKRLGDFRFTSRIFGADHQTGPSGSVMWTVGNRFAASWLGSLPVPLPENYVRGIDEQRNDFETGRISYLRGEFRDHGWLHYYLYAMLVKMTLGFWVLFVLSVFVILWYGKVLADWRDELILIVPALGFLTFVSLQTGFNHHLRYVFPIFPLLFIFVSRVASARMVAHPWVLVVAFVALGGSVLSCLRVYPHTLSYFNELAGGPENGPAHLLDSNVDWGQDLTFLERWHDAHPDAQPLTIVYFGLYEPATLYPGWRDQPRFDRAAWMQHGPKPGWFAISVNQLYGYARGTGNRPNADLALFHHLQPVARAGYSIYIYHISAADAERLRIQWGYVEPGKERIPTGEAP